MSTNDFANYRRLSEPFPDQESAKRRIGEFWDAAGEEGADSQFVRLTFEADNIKRPATWITARLHVDSSTVR